jgi:signal transduction histidine kinase
MYKEIALGLFHQVANQVNKIGIERQSTALENFELFKTNSSLKSFDEITRECVSNAKKLIKRAQERGKHNAPRLEKCMLIQDVLEPAIMEIQTAIDKTGQRFHFTKTLGKTEYHVETDKVYFRESLINVLNNSIHAVLDNKSQAENRIRVIIEETDKSDNNQAEVSIKIIDNGIGLDPNTRDRAFTAYYTTKGNKGTGLGLYFAKRIVDFSHGNIEFLRSHESIGTTLRITLPFTRKELRKQKHGR